MGVIENAALFMERTAADDSHGYDQGSRWGNPDYDCSSLVISAYKQAGLALNSTYTGNMKQDFLAHGFEDVTGQVNLITGTGLLRGDVLLHERNHTAMYIGNGKLVHAAGNEYGGATGGKPGDQTGKEICVANYFNYGSGGWDCVLRYTDTEPSGDTPATYTVQPGDYLGLIALRFGTTITELARLNNISNINLIFPGQVLILPGAGGYSTITITVKDSTLAAMKAAAGKRTIGEYLDSIMQIERTE